MNTLHLQVPEEIRRVWNQFDGHPMETLTKAWFYNQTTGSKQRSVAQMVEHREYYGTSGNCFDLSLWLIHELREAGIEAYAIGEAFGTAEAHCAVVALDDKGRRYFCDLGDQWIQPILLDYRSEEYSGEVVSGFITGGQLRIDRTVEEHAIFHCLRPNGKISTQSFDLQPVPDTDLLAAGAYSQELLRHPLVEMRIRTADEVKHWEYDRGKSFVSSNQGLIYESELHSIEDWAKRIYQMSGIHEEVVIIGLTTYSA